MSLRVDSALSRHAQALRCLVMLASTRVRETNQAGTATVRDEVVCVACFPWLKNTVISPVVKIYFPCAPSLYSNSGLRHSPRYSSIDTPTMHHRISHQPVLSVVSIQLPQVMFLHHFAVKRNESAPSVSRLHPPSIREQAFESHLFYSVLCFLAVERRQTIRRLEECEPSHCPVTKSRTSNYGCDNLAYVALRQCEAAGWTFSEAGWRDAGRSESKAETSPKRRHSKHHQSRPFTRLAVEMLLSSCGNFEI